MIGLSYFTSALCSSVINAVAMYPESKRNPSTKSRLVSKDLASSIVTEPFLPAKSIAFVTSFPITESPFADMVAIF